MENNSKTLEEPQSLNAEQWQDILTRVGQHVQAELCLIGSASCMFSGMIRTSIDLDVWRPASTFQNQELRNAVEAEGLLFNPTEEVVDRPYIQIVDPGIVQTGHFEKTTPLAKTGQIHLSRPPIENLIASKLVRGEPKDIEDISHLIQQFSPDLTLVTEAVQSMPKAQREKAFENLVYLEILTASPDI